MATKYFLNEFKGRDKANLATKCILVYRTRIKLGMFRAKSKSRFILMDLNPRWLCLGSNRVPIRSSFRSVHHGGRCHMAFCKR